MEVLWLPAIAAGLCLLVARDRDLTARLRRAEAKIRQLTPALAPVLAVTDTDGDSDAGN